MSAEKKVTLTRRDFLQTAVATTVTATTVTRGLSTGVPDKPALKAGLIGCGGRGRGAAHDLLKSAPNVQITALADVFQDRLDSTRKSLEETGQTISKDRCFIGFDAYQKLIETDVDMVLLATPPHFRPQHFAAAVEAGKHVFMEKPVAVDPVGIRSILATGEKAASLGLSVVAGTQRRHKWPYLETQKRVAAGAIGDIVAARCYWNQAQLWYRLRQPGWSDMEWMIRDWVNWCWLSGDHIVEQHVHNIDVVEWFTGIHPQKAVGMGGRMRRVTGDQYDFFGVDYEFANGVHVHSMCRQINGCINNVSEYVVGTKGSTNCKDTIYDLNGKVVWVYNGENPPEYVQEQADLVAAIRGGEPINETRNVAQSTLTAIMGRLSAYTGKETVRDEVFNLNMRLGPSEYAWGDVPQGTAPLPGTDLPARERAEG